VVTGERDLVRPEHTRLIVESIPGARAAVVARAGHMLPTQAPQRLSALVADFLAEPLPGEPSGGTSEDSPTKT